MTRATRLLALGRFSDAWRFNPGSFVVLLSVAVALTRGAVEIIAGRWVHLSVTTRPLVIGLIVAAVTALWVNQQLHAALLMSAAS